MEVTVVPKQEAQHCSFCSLSSGNSGINGITVETLSYKRKVTLQIEELKKAKESDRHHLKRANGQKFTQWKELHR